MKGLLVLYPCTLFQPQLLLKQCKQYCMSNDIECNEIQFVIIKHSHYYTDYNYNPIKLRLYDEAIKDYVKQLKQMKYKCKVYESEQDYHQEKNIIYFNIEVVSRKVQNQDQRQYEKKEQQKNKEQEYYISSPGFLISYSQLKEFMPEKKAIFQFFHNFFIKRDPILSEIYVKVIRPYIRYKKDNLKNQQTKGYSSLDGFNRSKVSKRNHTQEQLQELKECDKEIQYPINHEQARERMQFFVDEKFQYFAKYMDSVNQDMNIIYHSFMSQSLNMGLITPHDCIDIINVTFDQLLKRHKLNIYKEMDQQLWEKQLKSFFEQKDVQCFLDSYEAYIRQLYWREYQRYCYYHIDLKNMNTLSTRERIKRKKKQYQKKNNEKEDNIGLQMFQDCDIYWPPIVKETMNKAWRNGYIHHIERLMVVGNYLVLNEIHKEDIFQWFMEFACDSYEWVMWQNVYDMVCFSSGGMTSRKPYVSSSNYILKQSDYGTKGQCSRIRKQKLENDENDENKKKDIQIDWCKHWDQLYDKFIIKYKKYMRY